MFIVSDSIHVNAPIERCFLLSTNIELVKRTLGMNVAASGSTRTAGMVEGGDRLLWRGWVFGLPQMHESLITRYEPHSFFQDTMGRGRFSRFQHDHSFVEIGGRTLLSDKVRFSLPFGWAGSQVAQYLMVPYVSGLLRRRLELLKQVAESEEWREYVSVPNQTVGPN